MMEPYEKIFENLLCSKQLHLTVLEQCDLEKIITDTCYQALLAIGKVVADDRLDDKECFWRIEQIVSTLENTGIDCGGRHDF